MRIDAQMPNRGSARPPVRPARPPLVLILGVCLGLWMGVSTDARAQGIQWRRGKPPTRTSNQPEHDWQRPRRKSGEIRQVVYEETAIDEGAIEQAAFEDPAFEDDRLGFGQHDNSAEMETAEPNVGQARVQGIVAFDERAPEEDQLAQVREFDFPGPDAPQPEPAELPEPELPEPELPEPDLPESDMPEHDELDLEEELRVPYDQELPMEEPAPQDQREPFQLPPRDDLQLREPEDDAQVPLEDDRDLPFPDRDPLEDYLEDTLPRRDRRGPSTMTREEERRATEEICRQELADLKASTLADVGLDISVRGTEGEDYPFECSIAGAEVFRDRSWAEVTYMWKASALCHKPLYFEEVALERYGHSCGPCLQPIVSGAHFFSRLPILPYCMGYTPPCECMYTLGYYRPGSCAPYMIPAVPISLRGGLLQAGAVVGTAAIVP